MKQTNTKFSIKATAAFTLVLALFIFSYFSFATYQPKKIVEVREVKGYKTKNESVFDLPTPRYAKGLAYDQTVSSKKYTFQTDKSPQEIQDFYKNILLDDGWRLKKEGSTDTFFTAEYRKDDYTVTIWAHYDTDTKMTFASVEMLVLE
ncbi:MAG: hypothetical protein JW922_01910 [Paludibacteraceae bacterium]|nr:hypothetical protein [Paludibacteraceae bacterium]